MLFINKITDVCVCACVACPQVLDGEGPKDSGITNSHCIHCVSDQHTHDLCKYIFDMFVHSHMYSVHGTNYTYIC